MFMQTQNCMIQIWFMQISNMNQKQLIESPKIIYMNQNIVNQENGSYNEWVNMYDIIKQCSVI